MILMNYSQTKLVLAFQALEKLPREDLSEKNWDTLCAARKEMRLGSLHNMLSNLLVSTFHQPNHDRHGDIILIADRYVKDCIREVQSAATVYCRTAGPDGAIKTTEMGLAITKLCVAIWDWDADEVKEQVAAAKEQYPELIPLYLGPAEEVLAYWLK